MTDTVTWLTQESYDRLKGELDLLIANRPVIAAEINDRREEGDLRENGGYHAAREEQGQQEARIRQLQELLNNAKVGEAPKQSGVALPGFMLLLPVLIDKLLQAGANPKAARANGETALTGDILAQVKVAALAAAGSGFDAHAM